MANLTEAIEQYLKGLLQSSQGRTIDVQRAQLAERFSCAPSQINYVLATRFLVDHGYLVETFRGGGGFIRITHLEFDETQGWQDLYDSIGSDLDQARAEAILDRLGHEQLISGREQALMRAVLQREVLAVNLPWRDIVRANMLRAMLMVLRRGD